MNRKFAEEYLTYQQSYEALVTMGDGCLKINCPDNAEYEIEFDRCKTPEAILSWVHHLNEKNWMTTEITTRFIEVAGEHIGWMPFVPA